MLPRKHPLRNKIQSLRLKWCGHVERMDKGRIPKVAIKMIVGEKRTLDRSYSRWLCWEEIQDAGLWSNRDVERSFVQLSGNDDYFH